MMMLPRLNTRISCNRKDCLPGGILTEPIRVYVPQEVSQNILVAFPENTPGPLQGGVQFSGCANNILVALFVLLQNLSIESVGAANHGRARPPESICESIERGDKDAKAMRNPCTPAALALLRQTRRRRVGAEGKDAATVAPSRRSGGAGERNHRRFNRLGAAFTAGANEVTGMPVMYPDL
jgi:hypothetical protein